MSTQDEKILHACYEKLAQRYQSKRKPFDPSIDRECVRSITSKAARALTRLDEDGWMMTDLDVRQILICAKRLFTQYNVIMGRNPACITPELMAHMDLLMGAVVRQEARMISLIRVKETDRKVIDVNAIFGSKRVLKRLGTQIARDIVENAVQSETPEKEEPGEQIFYVTDFGKRYHQPSCAYCKGRNTKVLTSSMVMARKLSPCECIFGRRNGEVDRTNVTVFVDEAIRSVAWDQNGICGSTGSFSYIACWGCLKSEMEIKEENIIAQGVERLKEHVHVERITESAIGRVLFILTYDCGICGSVRIYTDNSSAAATWMRLSGNKRLAALFKAVEVRYIPRKQNRKADRLGRARVILDLPTSTYKDIVRQYLRVNDLEQQARQMDKIALAD